MTIARAIVLLFLGGLPLTSAASELEACGRGDVSCRSRAKPNKGAGLFQASISMQTQPNQKLAVMEEEDTKKSTSQFVLEQVVKLLTPASGNVNSAHALGSFAAYSIVIFAAAYIYRKYQSADTAYLCSSSDTKSPGFSYGLFSPERCLSGDKVMCLLSFCCIGIRWADTMHKARLCCNFWVALSIFTVLSGLSHYTKGFTSLVLMCLVVYCRQGLRQKYHLEHGTVKTCVIDIALWWCCFPLAALQEARQVEYVQPVKQMKVQ